MGRGHCEWPGCKRPATVEHEFGNRFCEGHSIVGRANYDTHGDHGISAEEYKARLDKARAWLREHPAEGV